MNFRVCYTYEDTRGLTRVVDETWLGRSTNSSLSSGSSGGGSRNDTDDAQLSSDRSTWWVAAAKASATMVAATKAADRVSARAWKVRFPAESRARFATTVDVVIQYIRLLCAVTGVYRRYVIILLPIIQLISYKYKCAYAYIINFKLLFLWLFLTIFRSICLKRLS